MYINNNLSLDKLDKSALIARVIIFVIFILLFFAFWNIQILKHEHYDKLAMGNITDSLEIKAPRGVMLDKNGFIIAENKINFILLLNRKKTKNIEKTLEKISKLTGKSIIILKKTLKKFNRVPKIRSVPLLKDLSFKNVVYIKSRPFEFQEFDIEVEPDRKYPLSRTASHIIGYMSEISEKELKSKTNNLYKLGDTIGQSGIEKQYEKFFRGKKGRRDVLKNNLGVIKKVLHELEPKIGNQVFLTIDIKLQKEIEELLVKKRLKGAIGVVDLKTGGILALISNPGFNPHDFWNQNDSIDKSFVSDLFLSIASQPYSYTKLLQVLVRLNI